MTDIDNLLADSTDDALTRLSASNVGGHVAELARQLAAHLEEVAALEERLAAEKAEVNRLKTLALPEALSLMGAKTFTTEDGVKVTVKDVVQGSLPKDPLQRALALEWLVEHELGDVIKHRVEVLLNKGDQETRSRVLTALESIGPAATVSTKDDVHPQTLNATLRGLLEAGAALPLDLFNLYVGKTVDVKLT